MKMAYKNLNFKVATKNLLQWLSDNFTITCFVAQVDDDDGDDFTGTRVKGVFVDNQDSDANAA